MFYILAKIFWVLAQPLSLAALLALTSFIFGFVRRRRLSLVFSGLAALLLLLGGFTTMGALLIQPLEQRFTRPDEPPAAVSTILVLGGSTLARVSTARGVAELNDAGDRLTEAVRLSQLYPAARIVFTGGVGMLEADAEPEAETARRFFLDLGVAPERLIFESAARNTDENAELSAALVGGGAGATLLVTSAFHMPRSVGLFRRVGVDVVAWPTDYRSSGADGFGLALANPIQNLDTLSVAIREWVGLFAYYLTGRIDSAFPGQTSN